MPRAEGGGANCGAGIYATDRCRAKLKKRRQRGGLVSATRVICVVCNKPLKRGPRQQRKRYHDACKGLPIKIQDSLREPRKRRVE